VIDIFLCLIAVTQGSELLFHQTSDVITPLHTTSHTLRCSLNDSASTPQVIVGRDLTHTDTNVKFITSILVLRDGKDIATISEHVTARAQSDLGNLQVKGQIYNLPTERGYLELTWDYPTSSQAGSYECQVDSINSAGHHVVYSTSLELEAKQPTLDDVVSHVHALQLVIDQLRHVEHGLVDCADSLHWPDRKSETDGTVVMLNVTHTFQRAYPQPPILQYGVDTMDHCVPHTYTCQRFEVDLLEVTTTGFTIRCGAWGSPYSMRHLKIVWSSFSQ